MPEQTLTVEIVKGDSGVRITEYTRTQGALLDLEKRFKGAVFDVTTTKGMKDAKEARKELRDLRTALEKRRRDLKAPVLEYTRALDGQAKAITARIEALESPVDQQIKDEEARKAREKAEAEAVERKRMDANRQRIERVRNRPLDMIGSKAAEIWDAYQEVQGFDLESLDQDFRTEGSLVKDEAAGRLHELYSQAQESEAAAIRENVARVEREKAEKEAQQKRDAERAAELAELEELRAFKAKQEAADPGLGASVVSLRQPEEDEKNRQSRDVVDRVRMDIANAARVPPEHIGVDYGAGDETATHGMGSADHDFMRALDSLVEVMKQAMPLECEAGRLEEVAEAILGEIIDGNITHVAYIGTPFIEDWA